MSQHTGPAPAGPQPNQIGREKLFNVACTKAFIAHPDSQDPAAMVGYKRTSCIWKGKSANGPWYRDCAVFKTGACVKLKDWAGFGLRSHTTTAAGKAVLVNGAISASLMDGGRVESGRRWRRYQGKRERYAR